MNDFTTQTDFQIHLDPYKRPKYSFGLVMGVDEFEQEQLYHIEKNRLHNRMLHGYGTVCGLQISVQDSSDMEKGPEVMVSSGIALNRLGQEIRIPSAQCAYLNQWLKNNSDTIMTTSPPETISINIVLCYRECETDNVPLPGVPCRSQDDTLAFSRIADDFELSLRPSASTSDTKDGAPTQMEEDMVRRFGELLARIVITTEYESISQEIMEAYVRGLAEEQGSPPLDSPPDMDTPLYLHPDSANEILRAVFRVWVTEVRPAILCKDGNCTSVSHEQSCSCVNLARLEFPVEIVDGNLQVKESAKDVIIHEDERPILMHTRLLQEWLLCGQFGAMQNDNSNQTFATLFLLNPVTIRVWIHYPQLLDIPEDALLVQVDDWPPGSPPQPVMVSRPIPDVNVFDLEFSEPLIHGNKVIVRFDSSRIIEMSSPFRILHDAIEEQDYAYLDQEGGILITYLGIDIPALGDLQDVELVDISNGNVLMHQEGQWIASDLPEGISTGDPAGGDLKGTYPNPWVKGLQGKSVADSEPILDGQVLTWNEVAEQWEPQSHDHVLDDLSDVNVPSPQEGQVLTWNEESAQWEPRSHDLVLNNLSDVNVPSPQEGQVLTWNEESVKWEPRSHDHVLDNLSDVEASSPEEGQVLSWNNVNWVPENYVHARHGPYEIVAAGIYNPKDPESITHYYGLNEIKWLDEEQFYLLTFDNFEPGKKTYIVKGLVMGDPGDPVLTLMFVGSTDEGLLVRIVDVNNNPQKAVFMVEISAFISL